MLPVSPVIPGETFKEINIAENQPEYLTLPAIYFSAGVVLSRWELDENEKEELRRTKTIYMFLLTFGGKPQPVMLKFARPAFPLTITDYEPLKTVPYDEKTLLAKIIVNEFELQNILAGASVYVFIRTNNQPLMPHSLQVGPAAYPEVEGMVLMCYSAELERAAEKSGLRSFIGECSKCEHSVIGTDSTFQYLEAHPLAAVICRECFEKEKAENPELSGLYLPESMAEYEKLKRN